MLIREGRQGRKPERAEGGSGRQHCPELAEPASPSGPPSMGLWTRPPQGRARSFCSGDHPRVRPALTDDLGGHSPRSASLWPCSVLVPLTLGGGPGPQPWRPAHHYPRPSHSIQGSFVPENSYSCSKAQTKCPLCRDALSVFSLAICASLGAPRCLLPTPSKDLPSCL